MPTSVDKLSSDSKDPQLKAALSDCIATEVNRGTPQDQAVAMCMEQARKRTGRELAPQGGGA